VASIDDRDGNNKFRLQETTMERVVLVVEYRSRQKELGKEEEKQTEEQ
jgi:hypothetical protein